MEEISGVAFIFNQKFFLELREETGELEKNVSPATHAMKPPVCFLQHFKYPLLSKSVCVFRNRPGEHSLLQRQHTLLCHDGEEAESPGQRGHHKCEFTHAHTHV